MTCDTCRHWLPFQPKVRDMGSCKRFPPALHYDAHFKRSVQAVPHTAAPDFCGEHTPVET